MLQETGKALGISIFFYFIQVLIYEICSTLTNSYVVYSLLGSIITIAVIYFIYRKELNKKLKEIKKDFNLKIFLIGILGIIITIILDRILALIIGSDSTNNAQVIKLIKSSPILMSINVIIISPLKEELIFRLPYKNTNKIIGLILSSIIFAFIHITKLSDLIYLIPYLIMSLSIGLNFFKNNNNIYISYLLHALNNLINVLLLIW